MADKKSITPMEHYNMSDFLKGKASKIITAIAEEDKSGFILKNGKPLVQPTRLRGIASSTRGWTLTELFSAIGL